MLGPKNLMGGPFDPPPPLDVRGLNHNDICPKVTKMGSIVGHRIDYNGARVLRDQRHIPSKT